MNDMNDRLAAILLEECCAMFRGLQKDAADHDGRYGSFPPCAVIVHKEYEPRYRGLVEALKAWEINGGTVREIQLPPPQIDINNRSGMYYHMGVFTFCFPDDLSQAQLSMTLGPRYGRGYTCSVDVSGEDIRLGEWNTEWVS